MIKIIVDCFGGDYSPKANIEGSLSALKKYNDLYLILTGDEKILNEELKDKDYDKKRIEIVHAPDVITPDEKPTDAIRLKPESSMMKGIKLLRTDDSISGLVSAGSTGSLVTAATVRIPRLRNVIRPAFCPLLPTINGRIVGICDTGANVDITPEHLRQYAIMAGLYLETVYDVKNPRVALVNIGIEDTKGDDLRKKAFPLLKETKQINFVGNMESRDLLSGKYDLVVTDGFAGNVLVKSTEGTALALLKKLKADIMESLLFKTGALLLTKLFKKEKEFFDYQNYGGSVLLGTSKTIIKGHGSSKGVAIEKCIEQAYKMEQNNIFEKIENTLNDIYKTEE